MPVRKFKKAYASFRVYGPELDPLDVTLALRLPPDHTHRAGEPRLSRSRKGLVLELSPYRDGHWSISTEAWVHSPRLEVHLEWLLNQLETRAAALGTLHQDGIQMNFFCYSLGSTAAPPSIPRSIRSRASALGVTIEIDHYLDAPVSSTNLDAESD